MTEIIVKESEVGFAYLQSLKKMIDIRKERRLIYKDTFLDDTNDFLLMQINNKIKRISIHLQNQTEINNIEKAEDNVIDLANYALFLACNLNKK